MSTDAPTAMKTQKGNLYAARSKQSNCPSIPIETNDAGAKSIKATQTNIEDFEIDATVLVFSFDLFIERNNVRVIPAAIKVCRPEDGAR